MTSRNFEVTAAHDSWWSEIWKFSRKARRHLPDELKAAEPPIPWRAIAGIGNILRQDYHETYPTVLWDTCSKDLKPLQTVNFTNPGCVGSSSRPTLNGAAPSGIVKVFLQTAPNGFLYITVPIVGLNVIQSSDR